MTILQRIRSRAGLLVGIIFVALLAFVLGDFLGGRSSMFAGAEDVGEIDGHTVDMQEWQTAQQQAELDFQINSQRNPTTEQENDQIQQQVWQGLLDKYLLAEGEYKKLGLVMTDEELAEQMLSDKPNPIMRQVFSDGQSQQIAPGFATPTGDLNMTAVRDYVKQLSPDKEQTKEAYYQWVVRERLIREYLLKQKYFNLIKKGLYVTTSQAQMEHKGDSTLFTIKYVAKKYSEVPDSTIAVSDEEAKTYYNANLYKYKEKDNKRNIEYVAFDVYPSADDITAAKESMTRLGKEFESKKPGREDTMFVMSETGKEYASQKLAPGQFPLGMDSVFMNAPKGAVIGPLQIGENLNLYKVLDKQMLADSGRVRHILISYQGAGGGGNARSKDQAKKLADSLVKVIKGGVKMESLVEKYTDDPGSKPMPQAPDPKMQAGNKGDYGWIKNNGQMVPEFTQYALTRKVGETDVVETQFGYHVMQTLERAKTEKPELTVVMIERKIEPSAKTQNEMYSKALEFASKNNTGELFEAAVKKDNLTKGVAPDITEGSRYINGIQQGAKDIARWVYAEETKKGSVSEPFSAGNRYIVAHLTAIKEKGYKPMEDVRQMIDVDVRKQKKAERFIAEFTKAKSSNIDGYAATLKTNVGTAANVSFNAPNIIGMGPEPEVMGKVYNMKKGQLSGPLKGNQGVYVVQVEEVKPAGELKDPKAKKAGMAAAFIYRVENDAYDILKEKADIKDNRAKLF